MITRDNYEEFFLLYTDNELSAAERREVETFVADHPDLHEEWKSLLQCRLTADTRLAFSDRSALYRPETDTPASTKDLQLTENLLLYIDNELDETSRQKIESLLRRHPVIARELTELQETVSHPDPTITFAEKDQLYRTEKERRIVLLPWLRAGIAAVVLAGVALAWLLYTGQQPEKPATGIAQKITPPLTPAISPAAAHNIIPPVTPEPVTALQYQEGRPKTKQDRPAKQIFQKHEQQPRDIATNNDAGDQRTVTPATIDPVKPSKETNVTPDVTVGNLPPAGDLAANVHFAVQTGIPKEQSSFATQALQQEANDQRNSNFISDEPAAPAKATLRGIFRKVTRAFGKTAERDDDGNRQVLVGAFPISIN